MVTTARDFNLLGLRADGINDTREADCLRCVLVWFMFVLNWLLVPTMGQSTRGPRAREDLLLMERLQGNEGGGNHFLPCRRHFCFQ
jgi:hypothetical protein